MPQSCTNAKTISCLIVSLSLLFATSIGVPSPSSALAQQSTRKSAEVSLPADSRCASGPHLGDLDYHSADTCVNLHRVQGAVANLRPPAIAQL